MSFYPNLGYKIRGTSFFDEFTSVETAYTYMSRARYSDKALTRADVGFPVNQSFSYFFSSITGIRE